MGQERIAEYPVWLCETNGSTKLPEKQTSNALGMMRAQIMEFEKIGKTTDIKPGEGQSYTIGERIVGVFNVDGEIYAINDLCPHMGASLSAGHVDGDSVSCPWHAWRFCVKDGKWCDNPKLSVETFDIKIEGDDLFVATEPNPTGETPRKGKNSEKDN